MTNRLKRLREPLDKTRLRKIAGQGFSFIPHRFLKDGFLSSLNRDELALYIFLVLAGNQYGVSFYAYDAICSLLRMPMEIYIEVRNSLIQRDLIAFNGTKFQVLSLPEKSLMQHREPLIEQADFEQHDSATIRRMILKQLHGDENEPC